MGASPVTLPSIGTFTPRLLSFITALAFVSSGNELKTGLSATVTVGAVEARTCPKVAADPKAFRGMDGFNAQRNRFQPKKFRSRP